MPPFAFKELQDFGIHGLSTGLQYPMAKPSAGQLSHCLRSGCKCTFSLSETTKSIFKPQQRCSAPSVRRSVCSATFWYGARREWGSRDRGSCMTISSTKTHAAPYFYTGRTDLILFMHLFWKCFGEHPLKAIICILKGGTAYDGFQKQTISTWADSKA